MNSEKPRSECQKCGRVVETIYPGNQCRRCFDSSRPQRFLPAILVAFTAFLAAFASADEPRFRLEPAEKPAADNPPDAPTGHSKPPVSPAGTTPQPTEQASRRPVVRVYSCANCPACEQLHADAKAADFPAELQEIPVAPAWITAYPTLHWQGRNGHWYQHVGWRGRRDFQAVFAPTVAAADALEVSTPAAAALPLIAQFQQFAGQSGSFQFAPDSQISADLGGGAALSYRKITGKYAVSGSQITVTFDQPGPHVDARKFGIHLGATVLGADYPEGGDPKLLGVSTTVKKFRIRLEEVP